MKASVEAPDTPRTRRRRPVTATVAAVLLAAGTVTAVTAVPASAATVDPSAWYVLVNRNSGKVLDVYGLATNDGGRIAQWSRNDGANQQWQFLDS
ncbi:RICIN domain-containing protein, partial [Actinosynnema sp. NPDC002837]